MRVALLAFSNMEYTVELTEALSKIEDVLVMLPDKHSKRFRDVMKPTLNLHTFHLPRMRYPTNLLTTYALFKKIVEFKADLIHLIKDHPWFNLSLPLFRRYCLVATIHDVVPHSHDRPSQRIPRFTYKPPIRYADKLIVHGQRLKDLMIREYHRSAEDIHVLPRGTNSIYTRYVEASAREEAHTLMYFGRIWGYKGIQYLIDAEPLIAREVPDVRIIIAGEGEDFRKYRERMVHPERFIVHNRFIPNDMVVKLFQQASLVVLPYIDASQSGVIPLAYAFKRPVIVTDVGSLPENVDHGVTGYVVPPRDAGKLADAITDLLKNDEKRKKMGENAYEKTGKELSWANIARRTVEVYKEALSKRASKRR